MIRCDSSYPDWRVLLTVVGERKGQRWRRHATHTPIMQIMNAAGVVAAVAERHAEIGDLLAHTPASDLSAPSLLPGWSRLTIACHLRFGAEANQSMTCATLNGEDAQYYPDGRAQQRPSTLRPRNEQPSEVVDSLRLEQANLDSLWRRLDPDQWELAIREPADNADLGPITLGMLALLRLTEVEVHGQDLDIGCRPWSEVFVDTGLPMRVRWLATRRSNHAATDESIHGRWVLRPTNGTPFAITAAKDGVVISEGPEADGDAEISGSKRDLLAFLLGRVEVSALSVSGDRQLAESFTEAFPAP